MKALIKNFLKVFGHALTVAVHERLDHQDHALDLIIDQNNRMARSQTALLQSSIHMVKVLNRMQTDLGAVKRGVTKLSGRNDRLVDAVDRTLVSVNELKQAAESQVRTVRGE